MSPLLKRSNSGSVLRSSTLKKSLSLAIFGILLITIGCDRKKDQEEDSVIEQMTETALHNAQNKDAEVIVIDGCEYIIYSIKKDYNDGYGFMAHKGNCNNPIHIYRKIETEVKN
jgi:hypothetical protein